MAFRPDERDMRPAPRRNDDNNGGGNGDGGMLSAFMPGQRRMLADQLASGFDGTPQQWGGILSKIYSPVRSGANFNYMKLGGGGGMGGGMGGPQTPQTTDQMVAVGRDGMPILSPDVVEQIRRNARRGGK